MEQIVDKQRKYFLTGETKNISFRLQQLKKLNAQIDIYTQELFTAFKADYNKCEFDVCSTEISLVKKELKYMIKHLKSLAKPKRVSTSLVNFPSRGYICPEPYGVCLVVAPWNYPFQLSLMPLLSAIATGNTVIIKLSVNTPKVSQTIEKMLSVFDEKYIYVTKPKDREKIFEQKYDFAFYTGSTSVGKKLLQKQAEFLTPCVLELGGKSPCIVDEDADLNLCAKRLVWGKFLNAGQTCVAPDYVCIHKNIKAEFIEKVKKYINEYYYIDGTISNNFPFVINEKYLKNLLDLIKNEEIIIGGKATERLLEPTVLNNITFDSDIMQEEIFGPIMPLIDFDDIDSLIKILQNKEKPLAFYYFGKKNAKKCLNECSFGGGCINEAIMHLTEEKMPFGGVGFSGMGSYHGKKSFETFSHNRSVLVKGKMEMNIKYPPYNAKKLNMVKWLFKIKK